MTYESSTQTLICTSTGGPATSVTWRRDNTPLVVDGTTYEHSQIITDTDTATYQNRLRIVDKSATLSGTYTCSVGNSRGSTSVPVEIAGKLGNGPQACQECADICRTAKIISPVYFQSVLLCSRNDMMGYSCLNSL